ncbi:hypothetical protein [Planomicrobium sp. CPCC 101079]|uniref:hypothetical protein n=1 Tax=Planomicrobium sp. CPCC 101079 TaxID=2599618 RepID=UPI0011B73204|nr:hypothetical protein [Planomicrobium sp. CPCC 101079]TWT00120.1 hypothetical protein FQV28_18540 [Planomicrobium sp. CPCC 101079]
MKTINDVQEYLISRKDNMTAKRWLRNNRITQYILEEHFKWNRDFIRFDQESKTRDLSENIEYYLTNPWLIDNHFEPPL